MQAFIDDGYTETVGIEAVDGLYPAMEFTYRPFVNEESLEAWRAIAIGPTAVAPGHRPKTPKQKKDLEKKIADEQTPESIKQRLFDLLVKRVSAWGFPTIADPLEEIELSADKLNRMRPKLFERLKDIVFGDGLADYRLDENGARQPVAEEDASTDAGN